MAFLDRRCAKVLLTVLFFALVLSIVYIARAVIIIFCFSILFAYLINPVVRFLQRNSLFFKNLKGPHVAEAYLGLLILVALLVHVLVPDFLGHAARILREVPTLADRLSTGEFATEIGGKYQWTDTQTIRFKTFLVQHRSNIQSLLGATGRFVTAAAGGAVVIPILAIFFLSDGGGLAAQIIRLVSTSENYEAIQSLAAELNTMLQHYIRAKVILGGLSLIYCSAGLFVLGFPHAAMLGVMAGVLEFIPVAGWIIAAATIVSIGALTHAHWIWMALLLGVWRMLMDYWIAPRVMGHELEIHPLLAIFATMVGGAVGGIVGVYLSIPLVATLRVVWHRFAPFAPETQRPHELLSASHNDP
jgi:predicted PurR-regulated permease PerM